MQIIKKILSNFDMCYAVNSFTILGTESFLFATEGYGSCISYAFPDNVKTVIWDEPGGTMSIVPIPGKDGEFLATQKFFQGFNSAESCVVWCKPHSIDKWEVVKVLDLPYLHRFDIISHNGLEYFIGCTLCTSKRFIDDWSDPGKIYVGILPRKMPHPIKLNVLKSGLVKNHGYSRTIVKGTNCALIACESGVYRITPPVVESLDWQIEHILDHAVSEVVAADIDEDGEDELVTIEPFHGKHFIIYKNSKDGYKEIYRYPKRMEFAHVLWSGKIAGRPAIIGGYRREGQELFAITCTDKNHSVFHTQTIDRNVGPSNICVISKPDCDIIASANRQIGQATLYYVKE